MIDTSDFHNGLNIEFDKVYYNVIWFQHHKPGKGGAVVRVKLKNLHTGSIIERSFKSGEKFRELNLERIKMQFLYREGEIFHFMNLETYEQIELGPEMVGENSGFLTDNMEISSLYLEGKLIGIELPTSVVLKVVYTEPGIKGDTVSNAQKPADLETGVKVMVPMFVNLGDNIRVDTRTGEYLERVQS